MFSKLNLFYIISNCKVVSKKILVAQGKYLMSRMASCSFSTCPQKKPWTLLFFRMGDEPVECESLPPIIIAVLRRSRAFQFWASIWAMATSKRLRLSHLFRLLSFAGVPRKRSYIIWVFDAHRKELAIGHGGEPNLHRIMPM